MLQTTQPRQDDVRFQSDLKAVSPADLDGFFAGWPRPLDGQALYEILEASSHYWLALEGDSVVGFVNALSDGRLAAFVPLIEVREACQGRGIGRELMALMLGTLRDHYSVDLVCDAEVAGFYESSGAVRLVGCGWRNREAPLFGRLGSASSQG